MAEAAAALATALALVLLLGQASFSHAGPVNRQASGHNALRPDARNQSHSEHSVAVCVSDDVLYQAGDAMPAPTPCARCVCRPPRSECAPVACAQRPGCKALQRPNQCCPEFQCECERNGRIYANGERLTDGDAEGEGGAGGDPCRACYCRGGEVVCAAVECYRRDDCEPQLVPGRCCPKYDHCPPLAMEERPHHTRATHAQSGDEQQLGASSNVQETSVHPPIDVAVPAEPWSDGPVPATTDPAAAPTTALQDPAPAPTTTPQDQAPASTTAPQDPAPAPTTAPQDPAPASTTAPQEEEEETPLTRLFMLSKEAELDLATTVSTEYTDLPDEMATTPDVTDSATATDTDAGAAHETTVAAADEQQEQSTDTPLTTVSAVAAASTDSSPEFKDLDEWASSSSKDASKTSSSSSELLPDSSAGSFPSFPSSSSSSDESTSHVLASSVNAETAKPDHVPSFSSSESSSSDSSEEAAASTTEAIDKHTDEEKSAFEKNEQQHVVLDDSSKEGSSSTSMETNYKHTIQKGQPHIVLDENGGPPILLIGDDLANHQMDIVVATASTEEGEAAATTAQPQQHVTISDAPLPGLAVDDLRRTLGEDAKTEEDWTTAAITATANPNTVNEPTTLLTDIKNERRQDGTEDKTDVNFRNQEAEESFTTEYPYTVTAATDINNTDALEEDANTPIEQITESVKEVGETTQKVNDDDDNDEPISIKLKGFTSSGKESQEVTTESATDVASTLLSVTDQASVTDLMLGDQPQSDAPAVRLQLSEKEEPFTENSELKNELESTTDKIQTTQSDQSTEALVRTAFDEESPSTQQPDNPPQTTISEENAEAATTQMQSIQLETKTDVEKEGEVAGVTTSEEASTPPPDTTSSDCIADVISVAQADAKINPEVLGLKPQGNATVVTAASTTVADLETTLSPQWLKKDHENGESTVPTDGIRETETGTTSTILDLETTLSPQLYKADNEDTKTDKEPSHDGEEVQTGTTATTILDLETTLSPQWLKADNESAKADEASTNGDVQTGTTTTTILDLETTLSPQWLKADNESAKQDEASSHGSEMQTGTTASTVLDLETTLSPQWLKADNESTKAEEAPAHSVGKEAETTTTTTTDPRAPSTDDYNHGEASEQQRVERRVDETDKKDLFLLQDFFTKLYRHQIATDAVGEKH